MLDSISFFRIIKTGFVNFWRNRWLSAAATLIMVVTLVIFSVLLLLFGVTKYSIESIRDRVDMSVYFKTGLAENKISQIRADLSKNPLVADVRYTTATQALENFRAAHKSDPLILQSLSELTDNPLPATLQIKAVNLESYPKVAESLQKGDYKESIEKVNFEDNRSVIERLSKILRLIVTLGIGLASVFAIIAILVIFNTITLTIYNRREEVEIMRLVGATNWYIRGPFIIEALLYSVVATVLTTALLIPLYTKIVPQIDTYLGGGSTVFDQFYLQFPVVVGMELAIAVILSVLSSTLAIRRYLKI